MRERQCAETENDGAAERADANRPKRGSCRFRAISARYRISHFSIRDKMESRVRAAAAAFQLNSRVLNIPRAPHSSPPMTMSRCLSRRALLNCCARARARMCQDTRNGARFSRFYEAHNFIIPSRSRTRDLPQSAPLCSLHVERTALQCERRDCATASLISRAIDIAAPAYNPSPTP